MRKIPQDIESQLEELGILYTERHALFIYADGGILPPDFVSERIVRRIGKDNYSRALALLSNDRLLEQFSEKLTQSNLRAATLDNFPSGVPHAIPVASTTPTFRTRISRRGRHTIVAMVGCVV